MDPRPDWIPLVEAARLGDRAAQSDLLARFEPLTQSTARRLVPAGLVDDVMQQSYVAVLESISGLRTPEAFPAWLRLIVRKQAARLRANHTSSDINPVAEPADSAPGPAEEAIRSEAAVVVRLALAAARDRDRRLLELRYLGGWGNDELANLLGIKPGAVRKRLYDARQRLRPALEELNPNKEQTMSPYRPLLGAVHDPSVSVATPPSLQRPANTRTTTGLKVIDTLAPIRRGGTIEMVGPAGTGHVVVTLELLYRLGRTEHDIACIGVGQARTAIGSQPDLGHIVIEEGLPGPNAAVMFGSAADALLAFEAGKRLAAGLASEGLDIVLVVDRPTLEEVNPSQLHDAAGLAEEGSVTVVALNTHDQAGYPVDRLGLDTTLTFSLEHLALGIFPAIDGAQSTSALAITDMAEAAKHRLAEAAELRSWFNQPMYVAQEHTGMDGTWIEPATTEAELTDLTR